MGISHKFPPQMAKNLWPLPIVSGSQSDWGRPLGERMATFRLAAFLRSCVTIGSRPPFAPALFCWIVISLALAACASTRPVVKIGLLAPFEGLHRQSGYDALAAMRFALAEYPLSGVEVLPLALDTSADPAQARRAAEKLLRDHSVVAVVGPLQQRQAAAVADLIAATDADWRLPTASASEDQAQALVAALVAQIDGHTILLAGLDAGWPQLSAGEWSARTGKEIFVSGQAGQAALQAEEPDIGVADGILWLGDAEAGAAFLAHLRTQDRSIPFWTTSIAGDPVFSWLLLERLETEGLPLGPVYWGLAFDESGSEYGEWAATHAPATPAAYAVYRATQKALAQIAGDGPLSAGQGLAVFALHADGSSALTEIASFP